MRRRPITHLVLETFSSDEDHNGDCDYSLVALSAEYALYLLEYMDQVRALYRADDSVYGLELWDAEATYFRDHDRLGELRGVDGRGLADIDHGVPFLLTADPRLGPDEFARVECRTVQLGRDEAWWTAYVKDTNIRIETAHVEKTTLLKICRSLGGVRHPRRGGAGSVPPAVRRIHDLLYLDMNGGREFYDPDKTWDADVLDRVAQVVAEFIPRPPPIEP